MPAPRAAAVEIRPLAPADFEAVVALDRGASGVARRGYFERRLASALREPTRHVQLAAVLDGRAGGFALARRSGGEFGRPAAALVLETIGVGPGARAGGIGRQLLDALVERMKARSIPALVTQVDWRHPTLPAFFARAGLLVAPRQVLELPVGRVPFEEVEGDEAPPPVVRHLVAQDLWAVTKIDRSQHGRERTEYLQRKFDEVLHESAIEISLVVESQGLPVGFVMARVDLGDFGHPAPVASLDTIGVQQDFAGQGYGRALLVQLQNNLAALHVERLQTEVAREELALLGWLYRAGFQPSQRLALERRVAG